jgi:hypothetical protein
MHSSRFSSCPATPNLLPAWEDCGRFLVENLLMETNPQSRRFAQGCRAKFQFLCSARSFRIVGRLDSKQAITRGDISRLDIRYTQNDHSTEFAHQARLDFVNCIRQGEAQADLAGAALAIAAEDDAIGANCKRRMTNFWL